MMDKSVKKPHIGAMTPTELDRRLSELSAKMLTGKATDGDVVRYQELVQARRSMLTRFKPTKSHRRRHTSANAMPVFKNLADDEPEPAH